MRFERLNDDNNVRYCLAVLAHCTSVFTLVALWLELCFFFFTLKLINENTAGVSFAYLGTLFHSFVWGWRLLLLLWLSGDTERV